MNNKRVIKTVVFGVMDCQIKAGRLMSNG